MRDNFRIMHCPDCGETLCIRIVSHREARAACNNHLCSFYAEWRYRDSIEMKSIPGGIPSEQKTRIAATRAMYENRVKRQEILYKIGKIVKSYQQDQIVISS